MLNQGSCCSTRERKQEKGTLAHSLRRAAWILTWGNNGGGPTGWAGGLTQVVCPCPWRCYVQESCAVPCFLLPAPQKLVVYFWPFCILLLIIAPTVHGVVILVTYSFFVSSCSVETFVQVQALQQKIPGPSLSQMGKEPNSQNCITIAFFLKCHNLKPTLKFSQSILAETSKISSL